MLINFNMRQELYFSDSRLTEMMHSAGIRPSVQRIAVLSEIANRRSHPSAEDIFCSLSPKYPSLSRTTVYNSLHALVEGGLVRELDIECGCQHYDLLPQPVHSHFMCRRCGQIFDMPMPAGLAEKVSEGFAVDCIDLYFKGICPKCVEKDVCKSTDMM